MSTGLGIERLAQMALKSTNHEVVKLLLQGNGVTETDIISALKKSSFVYLLKFPRGKRLQLDIEGETVVDLEIRLGENMDEDIVMHNPDGTVYKVETKNIDRELQTILKQLASIILEAIENRNTISFSLIDILANSNSENES